MKQLLRLAACTFLISAVINLSCQKEFSCEGCMKTNKPPIAYAGADQQITLPTDSTNLDGSSSTDPDGTITSYTWKKITGPASLNIIKPDASKTVVKNLAKGVYQFELTIKDNGGLAAKDTLQVIVVDPADENKPPIACAGADQVITLPTNTVNLNGNCSSDPDNNITGYTWTKITGPVTYNITNANSVQTQVTNLVEGFYQFELKVTDTEGLFSKDTIHIIVEPAVNQPPLACAGDDQIIALPANTITLNGSCSSDPDNNITEYLWTKISGPSSFIIINRNGVQTQVNNLVQGVYLFQLKVTDVNGLFDIDTIQIRVMLVNQPLTCSNCKIVFVSNRDGNAEIYSCNADGSNVTRLTNNTWKDDEPVWSPDGKQIAFVSERTGNPEIYIMSADGSNVVQKTFSSKYSQNPAWSPDGARIAYSTHSNGSQNIWVVGINGPPTLLYENRGYLVHPNWSPDGTKLALVSDWMAFDIVYDIYTINSDGSNFTPLTGYILFDQFDYLCPSWSPNGMKIAMAISQQFGIDQYNTSVGIMNSDGTSLNTIITGAAPYTRTSWSFDGTKILYTSLSGSEYNISWVSADGLSSGTIVTNGWNADW